LAVILLCRKEVVPQSWGESMTRFRPIHLLLFPPYIALLWVGLYNRVEPALFGIPFFYWYQLVWIPLGALLLYPIYRTEERQKD
jgi:hypothetical protein